MRIRPWALTAFCAAVVCALIAEAKEFKLAMIERNKHGKRGRRGAELMPVLYADLANAMSEQMAAILEDFFQHLSRKARRAVFHVIGRGKMPAADASALPEVADAR